MVIRCKEYETLKLAILRDLRSDFNLYQHRRQGGLHYPLEHFRCGSQSAMPHHVQTARFRGEWLHLDRGPGRW